MITGEDKHTIASIWSLVYDSAEILIKSLTYIIEHKSHKIMYFEKKTTCHIETNLIRKCIS